MSIHTVKVRLITIAEGVRDFRQPNRLLGLRGKRISVGDLLSPMVDVEGKVYDLLAERRLAVVPMGRTTRNR